MSEKKSKKKLIIIGAVSLVIVLVLVVLGLQLLNRQKVTAKPEYVMEPDRERTYSETAGVPSFSADSGFYEEEFLLTIASDGGCIFYTLDGTDPATGSTAVEYKNPIRIYDNTKEANTVSAERDITLGEYSQPYYRVDKGMILRAAVRDAAGNFGETVTKSYFVGKTADYYKEMRVISLVTNPYNLFDPEKGIYVVGNGYYRWKESSDFDPAMEEWRQENPTNYNNSGKEWERPATIQVFEQGQPVYEQNLGIRLSGNVSRSNAQKSIRLYAREEYGDKKIRYAFFDGLTDINGDSIDKFDKVTLRNDGNDTTSAFFRDELVQSLCADRAVGTQAESPCILFINGEFWGMYHIKERIEDYYFASHYQVDKSNVTYIKADEVEGSEEVATAYAEFYKWAVTANLSLEENYKRVADTIDMQSFMDYFAIETYINNYDWLYVGRTPNNILMWRVNEAEEDNPFGDGKWRFVLYDMEYSANLYGQDGTKPQYNSFENISTKVEWDNPGALFFRLLDNDSFRQAFYKNYLEIIENNFDPERVCDWVYEYSTEYYAPITDTFKRFLSEDSKSGFFEYHVNTVIDFYNTRPAYAKQYLEELCRP